MSVVEVTTGDESVVVVMDDDVSIIQTPEPGPLGGGTVVISLSADAPP